LLRLGVSGSLVRRSQGKAGKTAPSSQGYHQVKSLGAAHSLLGWCDLINDLLFVTVKRIIQISQSRCLVLVCILEFLNPNLFLGFQTRDFLLDLNAFFIFIVNLSNQI
jgi:hypothetical protein